MEHLPQLADAAVVVDDDDKWVGLVWELVAAVVAVVVVVVVAVVVAIQVVAVSDVEVMVVEACETIAVPIVPKPKILR